MYPIWAALGGAVSLSAFFCTRQITTSPGFRCVASQRQRPAVSSLGRYSAASARRRARPRAGSPHARHAVARTPRGTARDARLSHARAFHERTWSGRETDLLSPSSRRAFPFRRLCSLLSARRSVYKDGRAEGVHEGKSRVKEGTQWREHSIRKLMRGVKPQIFPGLNDAMSK